MPMRPGQAYHTDGQSDTWTKQKREGELESDGHEDQGSMTLPTCGHVVVDCEEIEDSAEH